MPNEIDLWLKHLTTLQEIWKNLAPGFLEGDLKKFSHQKFSDLLPSNIFSADQIKQVMASVGAQCQAQGIGIPTNATLQDLNQTAIEFINRVSNVSIAPALLRLFRTIGIEANPNLANFGINAVAGMTPDEVLGTADFAANQHKQKIHGILTQSFSAGLYDLDAAQLQTLLDSSSLQMHDVVKRIVDG